MDKSSNIGTEVYGNFEKVQNISVVNLRECSPSNPRIQDSDVLDYVDNKRDYHRNLMKEMLSVCN